MHQIYTYTKYILHAEKLKNVTVNSITNNGKRGYAGVSKASKNKDVEEV